MWFLQVVCTFYSHFKTYHSGHVDILLPPRYLTVKPGNTGLKRLVLASYYSMKGLKAAWKNEAAFRQEIIVFIIACPLALALPISLYEKLALISPLVLLLIVELLNSALEAVVDRIGSEHHDLSGRAKDMGSAAVLFSLILALATWTCVLYSNF